MPNPPKSGTLLKKLISASRSIITNQVGLPLGILRLHTSLYWLKQHGIKPLTADELGIVEAYHSQIMDFPLGEERQQWEASALQKEDEELDALTAAYRPQLFPILQRILTEASRGASSKAKIKNSFYKQHTTLSVAAGRNVITVC